MDSKGRGTGEAQRLHFLECVNPNLLCSFSLCICPHRLCLKAYKEELTTSLAVKGSIQRHRKVAFLNVRQVLFYSVFLVCPM